MFASTGGAIYGETDVLPTPEDAEINPEAPYGHAKYSAEGYCDLWRRLHGLSTVSLRFGNVYGPRQDPLGEAGVVAIFCGKLRDRRPADRFRRRHARRATIYMWRRSSGRLLIAAAQRRAAARSTSAPARSPRCSTWSTRSRKLGREMGIIGPDDPFEPQFAPARAGEVQRSALDPAKSREVLGFEAKVDLEEGLRRTLEWVAQEDAALRAQAS